MSKKTILYDEHVQNHATMIEFADYLMPVKYSSIEEEHNEVRTNVGVFDIAHMGVIVISGNDALSFINMIGSNYVTKEKGKLTYSLLLNKEGYPIDDLMVYLVDDNLIYLVVNASNKHNDLAWLLSNSTFFSVEVRSYFDEYVGIAVQGINSSKYISDITGVDVSDLKFMHFIKRDSLIVSRSGYTGEDGFEIYDIATNIHEYFVKALSLGIKPIGLGARDTLRFEANLPLYGHEISLSINPLEAGLTYGVNLEEHDFIGKEALIRLENNKKRHLVGIELIEKCVPRAGYQVFSLDNEEIGFITTGYLLPNKAPLALAIVDIGYRKIGTEVFVKIRDKFYKGFVRNKKFYQKNYVK